MDTNLFNMTMPVWANSHNSFTLNVSRERGQATHCKATGHYAVWRRENTCRQIVLQTLDQSDSYSRKHKTTFSVLSRNQWNTLIASVIEIIVWCHCVSFNVLQNISSYICIYRCTVYYCYLQQGVRCRSMVVFAHGAMGCRIDPSWWTHWAISRSRYCSMSGVK